MKTWLESILPAQALDIKVVEWDGRRVELAAPLAPNLNDKGTAFAGSIDALLDLAGWSAITLALRDAGIEAQVMIVKSATEYTAAVRADMTANTVIPAGEMEHVVQEIKRRGRSRLAIQSHLEAGGVPCAAMTAHYAIITAGTIIQTHGRESG